jgi:hypothetical protein
MQKAARVLTWVSSAQKSDSSPFVPIALFSLSGLAMSLGAIALGFSAQWL